MFFLTVLFDDRTVATPGSKCVSEYSGPLREHYDLPVYFLRPDSQPHETTLNISLLSSSYIPSLTSSRSSSKLARCRL